MPNVNPEKGRVDADDRHSFTRARSLPVEPEYSPEAVGRRALSVRVNAAQ
jgi:hypothetical protein